MRSPLAVRIKDGTRDVHVTDGCRSLSFTKTAPGGHQSAQLRLNLPRADFPDLGDADRLWYYDPRTGATIWEGYTNAPGTSQERGAGEGFDLTALGGMSLATDDRRALHYVDREQGNWRRSTASAASARTEWTTVPIVTNGNALVMGFTPGQPIGTGSYAALEYPFDQTDMEFGHAWFGVDGGKTDAAYKTEFHYNNGSWTAFDFGGTLSTTLNNPIIPDAADPGWPIPDGVVIFALALLRTGGATTIADDTTYAAWPAANMAILGRLLDKTGTRVGISTNSYVLASEVVTDLLGRILLPVCDGVAAAIAVTTVHLEQLVYWQAVTARTVLDDLGLWEPDYLWEILHTNSSGKHVFNWRAWPTTARYEISTADGYSKPGTDSGQCNRLVVRYTDEAGVPQTYTATAAVSALDDVGRVRHADPITLSAGQGSATDAAAIGTDVLADLNAGASAASAVVRRRITDLATGHQVEPFEIEPGYLVRVRETGDLLRLTEMTYDWSVDGASSARLSLGRPRLTVEQRVARLARIA